MNASKHLIEIVRYLVTEREPLGVTEISKGVGSNKSSIYRILSNLKQAQWVEQNPESKKYTLGMGLQELSVSVVSRFNLRSASLPYLSELSNATGETAMLTARVGFERLFIEQIECSHALRQIVDLGVRYPVFVGSPGKVILANMEPGEIKAVLNDFLKSGKYLLSTGEKLDIGKLKRDLEQIRQQGFSITVSERVKFSTGVAAPIFGRDNKPIGAISVGGPIPRFNAELAIKFAPLVSKSARDISLRMGYNAEQANVTRRDLNQKIDRSVKAKKVGHKI